MFKTSEEVISLNRDAFSHGQIMSKRWLIEELLNVLGDHPRSIQLAGVYGGWYGFMPLLLGFHKEFSQTHFVSFDKDLKSNDIAMRVNDALVVESNGFEAVPIDVNKIQWKQQLPDLIINTSCEHMAEHRWFENIPRGTLCVLQSNNMPLEDHCNTVETLEELKNLYPMSQTYFAKEKLFDYGDMAFKRFMLIGKC